MRYLGLILLTIFGTLSTAYAVNDPVLIQEQFSKSDALTSPSAISKFRLNYNCRNQFADGNLFQLEFETGAAVLGAGIDYHRVQVSARPEGLFLSRASETYEVRFAKDWKGALSIEKTNSDASKSYFYCVVTSPIIDYPITN